MTFKEVRQGNTVFVFDRNMVTVKKGVTSMVSLPHIDPKAPLNAGMVIDIDITVDGQTGKYVVPETSESVTTAGGLYLTPNNALLLNDIHNVKQQRQLVLNSVEQYKKDIEKCDTLLAEFDPVYKDRQQTETRLSKIEKAIESIPSIEETLGKMAKVLDKLS